MCHFWSHRAANRNQSLRSICSKWWEICLKRSRSFPSSRLTVELFGEVTRANPRTARIAWSKGYQIEWEMSPQTADSLSATRHICTSQRTSSDQFGRTDWSLRWEVVTGICLFSITAALRLSLRLITLTKKIWRECSGSTVSSELRKTVDESCSAPSTPPSIKIWERFLVSSTNRDNAKRRGHISYLSSCFCKIRVSLMC